jgi:hypothetical protein
MNRAISLREHTTKAVKSRVCSHSFSLLNSSVKRVKLLNCKHRSPEAETLRGQKDRIERTSRKVFLLKNYKIILGRPLDSNHGIELQNEHEEENESAAADAEWTVYFINLYPQKPRDRRYHDATKEGY